ncbi:ATP-binding protein [Flavobacterium supellecticarium]|uniref:histidine kinase n=1 Tax=Flavobacterium supellecticarium TaxID=2565924 RepID=A0A4S3ZPL4_9FLAO|nr:tetratricopeptide repeat-containing sensor histidine kinase [Flavobacterium supellecticarium]THF47420.1 ATP-binding protein [Flavobacterium supellecticarium]
MAPVVRQIQKHIANSATDADSSGTYRIAEINKALELAVAAKIDSLQLKAIAGKSETLNWYFTDQSESYTKDFLQFSELKKDTFYIAMAKRDLGRYYATKGKDTLAYGLLNNAKQLLDNRGKEDQEMYILLLQSDIVERSNDYGMVADLNVDVLKLNKKNNNRYYYASANNNLGIADKSMHNYRKAIENFEKAADSTDEPEDRWIIKNNIGLSYTYLGDYAKARPIFESVIQKTTVDATKARAYDNLGFMYYKAGDAKSLEYYKKGYEIRSNNPMLASDRIVSELHLSDYYKKSNPELARQYATTAYDRATKMRRIDDRLEALKRLTALSSGVAVKSYSLQFQELNDSISRVRQSKKNTFAQIKYEYKDTQEENLRRKASEAQKTAQLAKAETQKLGLAILILIGGSVIFFVFRRMREKNRIEKLLESYKTETRIAKKVHDELANDVFNAMTFAEIKDLSDAENKEILLESLDKIYTGSRNISRENSTIDTGTLYPEQLKEVIKGYKSERVNVMSSGMDQINWDEVDPTKKIVVYRVLQELLVNMKKHSKSSLVVVRFQLDANRIQIDYSDNGVGIDKNKLALKNGLQNVETRIKSISGTYTFDSVPNKGFKVSFSFPK